MAFATNPRIGVVGSRKFSTPAYKEWIFEMLDELYFIWGSFTVVSGGARGPDSYGVMWANERHQPVPLVFPAMWGDLTHPDALIKRRSDGTSYDALAGFRRNREIVENSDRLVVFMDLAHPTPGTSNTLDLAKEKGIPIFVFRPFTGVTFINCEGFLEFIEEWYDANQATLE